MTGEDARMTSCAGPTANLHGRGDSDSGCTGLRARPASWRKESVMNTRTIASGNADGSRVMDRTGRARRARVILRAAAFALAFLALSGPTPGFGAPVGHAPDEILVRFLPGSDALRRGALHAAARA